MCARHSYVCIIILSINYESFGFAVRGTFWPMESKYIGRQILMDWTFFKKIFPNQINCKILNEKINLWFYRFSSRKEAYKSNLSNWNKQPPKRLLDFILNMTNPLCSTINRMSRSFSTSIIQSNEALLVHGRLFSCVHTKRWPFFLSALQVFRPKICILFIRVCAYDRNIKCASYPLFRSGTLLFCGQAIPFTN